VDNKILGDENKLALASSNLGTMFLGIEAINQNRIRVFRLYGDHSSWGKSKQKETAPINKWSRELKDNFDFTKHDNIDPQEIDIQSIKICKSKLTHIVYSNKIDAVIAVNEHGKIIVKTLQTERVICEFKNTDHLKVSWLMLTRDEHYFMISDQMGYLIIYNIYFSEGLKRKDSWLNVKIKKVKLIHCGMEVTSGWLSGNGKSLIIGSLYWNCMKRYDLVDFDIKEDTNNLLNVFQKENMSDDIYRFVNFGYVIDKYLIDNSFKIKKNFVNFMNSIESREQIIKKLERTEAEKNKLEIKRKIEERILQNTKREKNEFREKNNGLMKELETFKMKYQKQSKLLFEAQKNSLQFHSYKREQNLLLKSGFDMNEKSTVYEDLPLETIIKDNSTYLTIFDFIKSEWFKNRGFEIFSPKDVMDKIKIDMTELSKVLDNIEKENKKFKERQNEKFKEIKKSKYKSRKKSPEKIKKLKKNKIKNPRFKEEKKFDDEFKNRDKIFKKTKKNNTKSFFHYPSVKFKGNKRTFSRPNSESSDG
jgi:hypothetical protein